MKSRVSTSGTKKCGIATNRTLSPGVLFQSRTARKGAITMTENEAVELLRSMQNPKQDYANVVCAPAFCTGFRFVYPEPEDYAIEEAIKALEEIQQYRKIGTVEECREAVEKQKAKKCVIDSCPDHTHYKCPSCGKIHLSRYKHGFPSLGRIPRFCDHCGRAIDENLE